MENQSRRKVITLYIGLLIGILGVIKAILYIIASPQPNLSSSTTKEQTQQTIVNINIAKAESLKLVHSKISSMNEPIQIPQIKTKSRSNINSLPKQNLHKLKTAIKIKNKNPKDKSTGETETECQITAVPSYHSEVNQATSTTGEIFVYTYCDSCHFRVKIDNDKVAYDVFHLEKTRTPSTYGYIPIEFKEGLHTIEIIDAKNHCHRLFPRFNVSFNQALYIRIEMDLF